MHGVELQTTKVPGFNQEKALVGTFSVIVKSSGTFIYGVVSGLDSVDPALCAGAHLPLADAAAEGGRQLGAGRVPQPGRDQGAGGLARQHPPQPQ